MEKVIAESVGDKKPVLKADLAEDKECVTPTVIQCP